MKISDTQKYTFNPDISKYSGSLEPLPLPTYCGFDKCKCLIPDGGSYAYRIINHHKVKYCDAWCREESKESKSTHFCKKCGEDVEPIRVRGQIRGWRRLCDDCLKQLKIIGSRTFYEQKDK